MQIRVASSANRSAIDTSSMNPSGSCRGEGDLHENVFSSGLVESTDHNAEIEESIAKNQHLVDEISSLRCALSDKKQEAGILQQKLIETLRRLQAFSTEISSLEVENKEHATMFACLAQEVQASHVEKIDLLDENARIALENQSSAAAHAEIKQKLSLLARDLERKQAAMEAVQDQVILTHFEMERLRFENEEYSKEISSLRVCNETINSQVFQLTEEEKVLKCELEDFGSAKGLAEQKVLALQASIASLGVQLSAFTEDEKHLLHQIFEAKARSQQLEDTDKAMASREADMVAHIRELQSQLHALRPGFDSTGGALDQEVKKIDNARTIDMIIAGNQSDLHLSSDMQNGDIDARCQHLRELESRVADLQIETQVLAYSNKDLEASFMQQQETEMVCTRLSENFKKLKGCLTEVEEQARCLQGKEVELEDKLQELIISVNKRSRLDGLTTPLVISGGTIVVIGLVALFLHMKAKSK
ncbi:hypothetical protein L7F22_004209 [Adiantum nelumboides]|nr:hypothetical protein [Adiantum nelumboides]